jgi:hypothetical protein
VQPDESAVVNHYDVQRVSDADCRVEGRDLGSAVVAMHHAIALLGTLLLGMRITVCAGKARR